MGPNASACTPLSWHRNAKLQARECLTHTATRPAGPANGSASCSALSWDIERLGGSPSIFEREPTLVSEYVARWCLKGKLCGNGDETLAKKGPGMTKLFML